MLMTATIESLVETLREELKQYGELMALLESQQQMVLERNADGMHSIAVEIDHQATVLEGMKTARLQAQQSLLASMGIDADTSFEDLFPKLPVDYQPLVKALVEENNRSIERIERIAKQNHSLLTRSIELINGLIKSVTPESKPDTYNQRGIKMSGSVAAQPTCEHIC